MMLGVAVCNQSIVQIYMLSNNGRNVLVDVAYIAHTAA